MGTNYFFRKRSLDLPRLEAIVDDLNNDFKALIAKYNKKFHAAAAEMGLIEGCDFDVERTFVLPDRYDEYGDIHVGKFSHGWKPLMQANEHFTSLKTLKQWEEENRHDYTFIDEYSEEVSFEDYIVKLHERNQNPEYKWHGYHKCSDGFEWTHMEFS